MLRLVLILLGADFIRARWLTVALVGAVWGALGVAIFIDALDGVTYFPIHLFGYLLIVEALVTLVATTSNLGTQTVLRKSRGVVFLLLGLLVIDPHWVSNFILAILFGIVFAVDGTFRIASAQVVRFRGWLLSLLAGVGEVMFAVFMLEPYPTFYVGTVPYCIGAGLILSGFGALRLAMNLRRLPSGTSLAAMLARTADPQTLALPRWDGGAPVSPLIVHVWTPLGSVQDAAPQPLVDRYVAAVDGKGTISTGHAALEVSPALYVSHYPADEIEHSPEDFRRILRATRENNVPGIFQPSYARESAEWCESTVKVVFERYDFARLQAFWSVYSRDTTYNLTNRNCSSTVAACVEAALEGAFRGEGRSGVNIFSAMLIPELWVASQLRRHAEAMAWTPGLVLDYARALRVAIDPPPLGWVTLAGVAAHVYRYARALRRGEPLTVSRKTELSPAVGRGPIRTAPLPSNGDDKH